MDKKKYLVLKDWGDHKKDTQIETEETDAIKALVEDGTLREYDAEAEKKAKEAQEAADKHLQELIQKGIEAAIKDSDGNIPTGIQITVHDKSDDDPSHGYGKGEYGFGLFGNDVYNAGKAGSQLPELLMKSQKRSEEVFTKAAGDGMTVGNEGEGGFLGPPEFSNMLLDVQLEQPVVRNMPTVILLGSNSLNLPIFEDLDHSNGTVFGGLQAFFEGEEDQLTESKPKLGKVELRLHKLTVLAFVSNELMRWSSVSMGSWLTQKMGEAIMFKEDDAFLNGTGAGMPLGLINAPGTLSIVKEVGQDADTIVYENILGLWTGHKVTNMQKVWWKANRDTFKQLALMEITVGTGGAPVYLPSNAAAGRPFETLMGAPIAYSEKLPALGDSGDIVLCDGSKYIIADDRSGPALAQSMHLKFDFAQDAFRLLKYVDGKPQDRKVFTPANGTDKSAFVKIDDRA